MDVKRNAQNDRYGGGRLHPSCDAQRSPYQVQSDSRGGTGSPFGNMTCASSGGNVLSAEIIGNSPVVATNVMHSFVPSAPTQSIRKDQQTTCQQNGSHQAAYAFPDVYGLSNGQKPFDPRVVQSIPNVYGVQQQQHQQQQQQEALSTFQHQSSSCSDIMNTVSSSGTPLRVEVFVETVPLNYDQIVHPKDKETAASVNNNMNYLPEVPRFVEKTVHDSGSSYVLVYRWDADWFEYSSEVVLRKMLSIQGVKEVLHGTKRISIVIGKTPDYVPADGILFSPLATTTSAISSNGNNNNGNGEGNANLLLTSSSRGSTIETNSASYAQRKKLDEIFPQENEKEKVIMDKVLIKFPNATPVEQGLLYSLVSKMMKNSELKRKELAKREKTKVTKRRKGGSRKRGETR